MELNSILENPDAASGIDPSDIPALLGKLETLRAMLNYRLISSSASNGNVKANESDRLMTIDEAAAKLGATKDWLYRSSRKLPFTVRNGRRQVRFSEKGIERYIRSRMGR